MTRRGGKTAWLHRQAYEWMIAHPGGRVLFIEPGGVVAITYDPRSALPERKVEMIEPANEIWLSLLRQVLTNGVKTAPHGRETYELLSSTVSVPMIRPAITVAARRLGYRFMAAEAAWIISGDDRVETIAPFAKHVARFSDDGKKFFGAYGPKFRDQLAYVVATLRRDPASRQAVINIWRETPRATKDVPCTLSCQFLIRENLLHAFVTMRSNDLWLGFPYDVFSASMWSAYLVLALGLPGLRLGTLYHTAASRHLYLDDGPGAWDCLRDPYPAFGYAPFDLAEFVSGDELLVHLWKLARKESTSHRWFAEAFNPDA